MLLARQAAALRAAGLRRVTVSLDTLRPERMQEFARSAPARGRDRGHRRGRRGRLRAVKLNTVVIRGFNDDEVVDLLEFAPRARRRGRASSSTWTWAAPPAGRMDQVVSRARSSTSRRAATARSSRSPDDAVGAGRAVRAAPTAPSSASSRRPPRRSAAPATAAGSPPTAPVLSASTARTGSICASRCAAARPTRRSPALIAADLARARRPRRRGARRPGGPRRPVSDREPARRSAARDAHARRLMALHVALIEPADPAQHRQHRPALRRHRHRAAPDRAAGLLARRRRGRAPGSTTGTQVDLWVHPDWFAFRDAMDREPLPLLLGQRASAATGRRPFGRTAASCSAARPRACRDRILEKHPGALLPHPDDRAGAEPQPRDRGRHRALRSAAADRRARGFAAEIRNAATFRARLRRDSRFDLNLNPQPAGPSCSRKSPSSAPGTSARPPPSGSPRRSWPAPSSWSTSSKAFRRARRSTSGSRRRSRASTRGSSAPTATTRRPAPTSFVVTAGIARKPGMSRDDLVNTNAGIVQLGLRADRPGRRRTRSSSWCRIRST